ncbi:hypothetical protein [Corynebacterium glutamicum]|uniref:hypothetical protein n=1 Tax=Corynebacterium glutamicum TaxID=1718 RepID=UPI000744B938|nr:hypothetical protein [Corynebacterium glutamicum]AMA00214.1 hypothetical protein APT58_08240 [Corynebacterium glutamicum]
MPVENILIEVPPRIAFLIEQGELKRTGSVVRNMAGEIVAHLDETSRTSETKELARLATDAIAQHKGLTATAMATVVVLGVGGVVLKRFNQKALKVKAVLEDEVEAPHQDPSMEMPQSDPDTSGPHLRSV